MIKRFLKRSAWLVFAALVLAAVVLPSDVYRPNPAQLAAAIKRMVRDIPFARACAERGFQQAAKFSWHAAADALVRAYEKAVTAAAEKRSP